MEVQNDSAHFSSQKKPFVFIFLVTLAETLSIVSAFLKADLEVTEPAVLNVVVHPNFLKVSSCKNYVVVKVENVWTQGSL